MSDFDSSLPVRTVSIEELQVKTKVGTKLNVATAAAGDVAVKLVDSAGTNLATVSAAGAVKVDGSAVTQPVSGTFWQATQPVSGTFWQTTQPVSGTVTATQATGTNLHTVVDSGSITVTQATGTNLHVSVDNFPADGDALAQGSTTSGQNGSLILGATTTASPTYTTATTNPLSLTTAGAVRTDSSATTQPVSGTFWQTTQPVSASSLPLPTGAATSAKQPALGTAGSASTDVITVQGIAGGTAMPVSGSLSITANSSINLNQIVGTTPDVNTGNASAGTLRVVLASNQPTINVNTNPKVDTVTVNYNTASSIATNATSTHSFTPGSTVSLSQISGSASGKMKMEIQYGTTGSETTQMVKFITPGNLNAIWTLPSPISVTSSQTVKIIRTNLDNQVQDLYSTIEVWA